MADPTPIAHFPACHFVDPTTSLNTCTACGGSTLLDPPCQPARDVPLIPADPTHTQLTAADREWLTGPLGEVLAAWTTGQGGPEAVANLHAAVAHLVAGGRADERERLTASVLAEVERAEADGRHVHADETYVATGLVRNALRWHDRPRFALDADVTVYWPEVRPCYECAPARPSDAEVAKAEVVCSGPCGLTTPEPHPRRLGVVRCSNCKEWLPASSNPTSQEPQ